MDSISLFQKLKNISGFDGSTKSWGTLYSSLFEMPNAEYTSFTKLGYFRHIREPIQRFQDIPDHFKTPNDPIKLFVSHRWETKDHPDPSGRTLRKLLSLSKNCSDDAAVWLDYCSLPQRRLTGDDDRSDDLKEYFKYQLSLIPLVVLDSQSIFLWETEGTTSGWCCIELLVAEALRQHLNRLIYNRKDSLISPPLFAAQVGNNTLIDSDLVRFENRMVQKMYCTKIAMERQTELIIWMNEKLNAGRPTPYSKVISKVTPELVVSMMQKQGLTFSNGSDLGVVSDMLTTIYRRLSEDPFDSFKWQGKQDFFQMWHYVKGSIGGCVVPTTAYRF